jgi:surface antigen
MFILVMTVFALSACQSDTSAVKASAPVSSRPSATTTALAPSAHHSAANSGTALPGILLTAWAGHDTVAALSNEDRTKNQISEGRAFTAPIGQQVTWSNPNDGNAGTTVPVSDSYNASGAYCRDFQQTIKIDGQQKQGYAKACQLADQSWSVVR